MCLAKTIVILIFGRMRSFKDLSGEELMRFSRREQITGRGVVMVCGIISVGDVRIVGKRGIREGIYVYEAEEAWYEQGYGYEKKGFPHQY